MKSQLILGWREKARDRRGGMAVHPMADGVRQILDRVGRRRVHPAAEPALRESKTDGLTALQVR